MTDYSKTAASSTDFSSPSSLKFSPSQLSNAAYSSSTTSL